MASLGGPNIITNGLVLALDAANNKSYPGSGATWYDLSGNNYHFVGSGSYGFSNNAITFNRNNAANTGTVFTLSNIANQLKIENFLGSNFTIETWIQPQTLSGSNTDATEPLQGVIIWPGWHNGITFSQSSTDFITIWNSPRTSLFGMSATSSLLSTTKYQHGNQSANA
jgi:hypothetical protein